MQIEETIFKMTEAANELYSYGEYGEAISLLLSIDRLCDSNSIDMPDEGVDLNVELDKKFKLNLFAHTLNFSGIPGSIEKIIKRGAK